MGNSTEHVLRVTAGVPVIVGVAPPVTVIVPPICPEQDGCDGMPPDDTAIVYVSVEAASEPVRAPFMSTVPLERPRMTGPPTPVSDCVSAHVMRVTIGVVDNMTSPAHVPVTFSGGVGWLMDVSVPQPAANNAAIQTSRAAGACMAGDLAKSMPCGFMLLSAAEEAR